MQSNQKLKVLHISAYDMDQYLELYHQGLCPSNHLYGLIELKQDPNIDLVLFKQRRTSWLNKIARLFDIELLSEQLSAIFSAKKWDVLYAPYATTSTKFILLAKFFKILRKPVVILVHQPLFGIPSSNRLKRWLVKQLILEYDSVVFLSEQMKLECIEAYNINHVHAETHFFNITVGVDMNYFKQYLKDSIPEENNFVISSGHTGRDFDILIYAFQKIKFPLKIYCKPESFPKASKIPENVEIISGDVPFERICRDYAAARMILIPLSPDPTGTIGMTSLLDAMAMGKPVIMTRSEKVDVEIEIEKIGKLVEVKDLRGWEETIAVTLYNYPLLDEMGANILRLGREQFSMDVFTKRLSKILWQTYSSNLLKGMGAFEKGKELIG